MFYIYHHTIIHLCKLGNLCFTKSKARHFNEVRNRRRSTYMYILLSKCCNKRKKVWHTYPDIPAKKCPQEKITMLVHNPLRKKECSCSQKCRCKRFWKGFLFVKTFFIGFQNWTKNKLELETLSTFHQITLDFVEKRGRPKSIAFCRKMWFFKVSLAKKWRLSFMTQFLITMMTIVKRILFGYCDPQKVLYVANSFSLQSFAKLSLVAHRIEASIMTNGFYCFFLLQFRMRLIFFCQWVGKAWGREFYTSNANR